MGEADTRNRNREKYWDWVPVAMAGVGAWASIQKSGSGPVDGQALPAGHRQLLGWVSLLLGEGGS